MSFLVVMVLLLVVMYVLMIRPQRQRQQQHQSMVDGAGVGEDVLTTGGIYGTVVQSEGDDIVVQIAEGVEVHMSRKGIAAVLPPEEAEEDADDDVVDAEVEEDDRNEMAAKDEALVTAGEPSVTSEAEVDAAAREHR